MSLKLGVANADLTYKWDDEKFGDISENSVVQFYSMHNAFSTSATDLNKN